MMDTVFKSIATVSRIALNALALFSGIVLGFIYFTEYKSISSYWATFLHLFSFAVLLGTHIYIVFVLGFVMIRTIPRHMFGQAQSKNLPAFHAVSTAMCCIMLSTLKTTSKSPLSWNDSKAIQIMIMFCCLVMTLMNYLWLTPLSVKIMWKMYLFEREAGVGQEIALKPPFNEELNMNPEYQETRKKFGKLHGITATLTLLVMAGLMFHLHYLTSLVQL